MLAKFLLFILLGLCSYGCKEKVREQKITIYRVDLDRLDSVSLLDLFSEIKLIPLELTDKSRITSAEMGIYKDRYIIFDHVWKKILCFDARGKFKYVVNDDRMVSIRSSALHGEGVMKSILKPLRYYYKDNWNTYLTFSTDVWKQGRNQDKRLAYRWDFGEYNDNKDSLVVFPQLPFPELMEIQKKWMHEHASFALSETKETDRYIYTLVERIFKRKDINDSAQFAHLFYDKNTGTYKLFDHFTEGVGLKEENSMNDSCVMMLVKYEEKDKYIDPALLTPAGKEIYKNMLPESNPVIVKYKLRNF